MRIGPPIAEAEMIATFLRAEVASERFGPDLLAALQRDRMSPAVVTDPDLDDPQQNAYRRHLLGTMRGYGQNRALFESFPTHVMWQRIWLTPAELLEVQYGVDPSFREICTLSCLISSIDLRTVSRYFTHARTTSSMPFRLLGVDWLT